MKKDLDLSFEWRVRKLLCPPMRIVAGPSPLIGGVIGLMSGFVSDYLFLRLSLLWIRLAKNLGLGGSLEAGASKAKFVIVLASILIRGD